MEEVKLFFEYEKFDSLEEFILNFEPFISNFQDKNLVIKELIKLCRNEKDELSKTKNEYLEEQYMNQVHMQIRKIKKIINYLKSKIEIKEEKITKPIRVKTEIVYKEKKKKETKKIKKKIIFKDEILKLVSEIDEYYDLNGLDVNEIIELIKYYQKEKDKIVNLKISLQSKGDSKQLDDAYKKLKMINQNLENLIKIKKEKTKSVKLSKKVEERHLKLPVSFQQIKEIDECFHVNTTDIITSIDNIEQDLIKTKELHDIYDTKIRELCNIYGVCKKEQLKYKMLLISKRRSLKRHNVIGGSQLFNEINASIKTANIHMDILNNLLNYLKAYQQSKPGINKDVVFQDEVEININQEMIEKKMEQGDVIDYYPLDDTLYALGHIIKYGVVNQKTLEYAKEIANRSIFDELEDSQIDGVYYVWDAIKYRLANTKEIEIRKILKDIRILFDFVVKNYKEDKTKIKHDYLFNLVDYFLKSEDNLLYLKKLINQLPKIVNVRHINKNKESEHIVIYIVDKFIENYRKMLKKDKYYVSKDYLKAVYLMFTRCYKLYLTDEEKKKIDKKLANFMNEVNQNLTSSGRKNAVKDDLRVMYTDKFYMHQKRDVLIDVDEHRLENALNSLFLNFKNAMTRNRVDLTDECVVKLGDPYTAYSIQNLEHETVLKIHVIDLYNLFISYSTIDSYLFNQTLKDEKLDSMIIDLIDMAKNETYPTITYEIIVDEKGNYKRKNGHIDNFKMYKSKIQIKKTYYNSDLIYSSGDVVLKSFRDLYRNIVIKNHMNYDKDYILSDMTKQFENMLNQAVEETFKFNQLPFIYSGIKHKNNNEFIKHMNNIGYILSRIDKDDFNVIYNILESNVDEFHYSSYPFEGDYNLSIKNPLSYPGILIQRMIHELILENKDNEEEYERRVKNYKQQVNETIMYLNYYNGYLDTDILKENKGKIKKITKILF